jgi:hypothetical protein
VIDVTDPALTVTGDWAAPEMYGVTVYEVIALEPWLAGARKLTVAPASFVIDVTFDGADGAVPLGRARPAPAEWPWEAAPAGEAITTGYSEMTSSGTTYRTLPVAPEVSNVRAIVEDGAMLISKPGVNHSPQLAPAVSGSVCDHAGAVFAIVGNVPVPEPLVVEKIHADAAAVVDCPIAFAVAVPTSTPVGVPETPRSRNVIDPFVGYDAVEPPVFTAMRTAEMFASTPAPHTPYIITHSVPMIPPVPIEMPATEPVPAFTSTL